QPADPEADAAVEDEQRARAHETGQQRERAGAPLVRVDDLHALLADDPGQPPRRARVPLPPHGNRHVREAGVTAARGPRLAGRGDDRDVMATLGETASQIAQLHRRAREEVPLRVDLEDPKGAVRHQAPKNSRTAIATVSISVTVWP